MMLRGKSLTLRLTLLFAAVSGAVLLGLGVVVGHLVQQHFIELDERELYGKLELVRHSLARVNATDNASDLHQLLDDAFTGEHDLAVRISNIDGRLLYTSTGFDFLHDPPMGTVGDRLQLVKDRQGAPSRLLSGYAALGGPDKTRAIVEVAASVSHHKVFMDSFRAILWLTVGLAAFASGALGWAAARSGLAPLRKISHDAAKITAQRLDQRVPVSTIPDELAEVAQAVNQMLARLQDSFRRLAEFSSDLAHELRTPVSNLMTQTQVILAQPRSADEYRDVLASNAEEYERLSRTIADMLFLAKADNDMLVPERELVNLRAESEALIDFYETLAEEKAIKLEVEGAAFATGDRLMLRRAIGNLLSNACRHTPRAGHIIIELLGPEAGMARILVRNTGETIPSEHLSHVFERFYRADASRKRDVEGAGLGLAITRSIMRAHGGEAYVQSSGGVTVFELQLPT